MEASMTDLIQFTVVTDRGNGPHVVAVTYDFGQAEKEFFKISEHDYKADVYVIRTDLVKAESAIVLDIP